MYFCCWPLDFGVKLSANEPPSPGAKVWFSSNQMVVQPQVGITR